MIPASTPSAVRKCLGGVPGIRLFARSIRELYAHRQLIVSLVRRDLKVRYKGSLFGFLWALLNPLLTMSIFLFIFSLVPRMSNIDHYAFFLLAGILPFTFFSSTLSRTVTILIDHTPLVKKIYFPREILPLSAVLADFVNHLLGLGLFLIALALVIPERLGFAWLLPLVLVAQLLFALGLAYFLSAAQVFLKDVAQILASILTFWYFLSPIFYPLDLIPVAYHRFYLLNPMASLVCLYRTVLLHRVEYPVQITLVAVVSASLMFIVGFMFYKKTENSFVKLL